MDACRANASAMRGSVCGGGRIWRSSGAVRLAIEAEREARAVPEMVLAELRRGMSLRLEQLGHGRSSRTCARTCSSCAVCRATSAPTTVSSVMTVKRVASEPVPAVVGTAKLWASWPGPRSSFRPHAA